MRPETLERMINQIAANAGGLSDAESIERVEVHLRTFWTPTMIAILSAAESEGSVTLTPVASAGLAAVTSTAPSSAPA